MTTEPLKQKKKLLYEVSIIRPIVIFLLVFLHSFTKIADGGGYQNDYHLNDTYLWIVRFISGFRIETIALIAGYVFSYQSHDLGRRYQFLPYMWKKLKRLIVPMVFFGLIYYFCFYYNPDTFTVSGFLLQLFSGCGHLWFLPMLFWSFLAIWLIDYLHCSSWWLLLGLAVLSIIPTLPLPLGFANLPHFLFYVYGGYFLWTKRDWLYKNCMKWPFAVTLWLIYIAIVIAFNVFVPDVSNDIGLMNKLLNAAWVNIIKLIKAVCGILALYLTVSMFTTQDGFKPKPWMVTASDNCYGVYVYHQFILIWLYFFTPFVTTMNDLLVPWCGFVITLVISLLLTRITLKTKIGRFLIG